MTSFHGLMGCPNLCSHQDLQLCKPESRSHPKPTGCCLCSALPSFAWMIIQRCCSMHHPKSLTWCSRASPCTGHSQILSGLNQRNVFTCWLFSASFHKALAFRTSAVSKTQSSLKHLKNVSWLILLHHKILSVLFSCLVTSTCSCCVLESSSADLPHCLSTASACSQAEQHRNSVQLLINSQNHHHEQQLKILIA